MYNRKAFKKEAKELIRASTPHYMLVTLVYWLLTTALVSVVDELSAITGFGAGIVSMFLGIVVALFGYVMSVGYSNYALCLSRKQETGMKSLFESFSYAGRSIGMTLLVALYTFAWTMLLVFGVVIVLVVLALALGEFTGLLIACASVLYIAVIVCVIIISLRYSMSAFVLAEDPGIGVTAAVRQSVKMMKGNKGKFFVLDLSFIGWDILLALISGVVLMIGFVVSSAGWFMGAFENAGSDPLQMMTVFEALTSQLSIWGLLGEVVCMPLLLWLLPYRQTACARFYNYASGYDQAMSAPAEATESEAPAVIPVAPAPEEKKGEETPAAPPAGGYYTSPAQEAPAEETAEDESEEI